MDGNKALPKIFSMLTATRTGTIFVRRAFTSLVIQLIRFGITTFCREDCSGAYAYAAENISHADPLPAGLHPNKRGRTAAVAARNEEARSGAPARPLPLN